MNELSQQLTRCRRCTRDRTNINVCVWQRFKRFNSKHLPPRGPSLLLPALTVLSSDAETAHRASGENSAHRTQFMCPVIVCRKRAPGSDHTFSVLSSDPDSSSRPSFENDTVRTVPECALL
jgi:hypothetical protein